MSHVLVDNWFYVKEGDQGERPREQEASLNPVPTWSSSHSRCSVVIYWISKWMISFEGVSSLDQSTSLMFPGNATEPLGLSFPLQGRYDSVHALIGMEDWVSENWTMTII